MRTDLRRLCFFHLVNLLWFAFACLGDVTGSSTGMASVIPVFALRAGITHLPTAEAFWRAVVVFVARGKRFAWAFPRGLRHFGGWASRQFPESTLFIGVAPSWENAATSFSAAPVLRVTFNALLKVCSSVSNFFCVSLLRRPQTRQSRKALFRCAPNRQVEARCFKLTNVETLSPLHWMQLWNLYRSTMTSFCGAKWFLRIVESCVYVFAKGAVGEHTSERMS